MVAEPQIEHIGRGVNRAQAAIKIERMRREGRLEALGRHDLDDIAGRDILLGRLDHREIAFARDVRGDRNFRVRVGWRTFEAGRNRGLAQPGDRLFDLILAAAISLLHGGELGDRHVRDYLESLAHVIEDQHDVGEHHVEIRHAQIVMHGGGNPRLETPYDIVGEETYRTAKKTREPGQLGRAQTLEFAPQLLEGICDPARLDRAARPDQVHSFAPRTYHRGGFRAEKG